MIQSGGSFLFKGFRCVIGAILSINEKHYMAAASHIFLGTDIESRVEVDNAEGIVRTFLKDYDVALIELPSGCAVEDTELGSAVVMEEALLINERHTIPCRVVHAGTSLHFLQFPCSAMPQPGDSGSPIQQKGKVVGLLSSVILSTCTGTAVSSDVLRSLTL